VFRRGGDVGFVAEELKAVFDPQGGGWMDGRYVPSVQAAIGNVIDEHLRRISAVGLRPADLQREAVASQSAADLRHPASIGGPPQFENRAAGAAVSTTADAADFCPKCQQPTYVRESGCATCRTCGFSQCD
jgi:ribonucleoside-diphosphate reductase alpha chain